MSIDRSSRHDRLAGQDVRGHDSSSAIGKQTLVAYEDDGATAAPIQRKELAGAGAMPANSAAIAAAGVGAGGGALPHLDRIQALFGRHDVRGVSAHVGGPATQATADLGASAYATGSQVAFASSPDLHTEAHEAAHVVQQRRGVASKDGAAGDAYEQHADAVADRVVAGESAEALLDVSPTGSAATAIARRELPDGAPLRGRGDWHAGDRLRLSGTFESANLFNLAANDHAQYTRIEERRDFYRWFYNYTSALKYTTRWALAASLVANGANQVAHMHPAMEGAAQLSGTITDELQGMMRIGNQVIFDNVFPKLYQLLRQAKDGPVVGGAALAADMQILAEEQSLIQPLYASVSPATIEALNNIARQRGFAGIGAWVTHGAHVEPGPYNKGGEMPEFGEGAASASITQVGDRWRYGMEVAKKFAPAPTGFAAGTPMPGVNGGYADGSELRASIRRATRTRRGS